MPFADNKCVRHVVSTLKNGLIETNIDAIGDLLPIGTIDEYP